MITCGRIRGTLVLSAIISVVAATEVVAVVLSAGDLIVTDRTLNDVLQVDPVTGNRNVVLSNTVDKATVFQAHLRVEGRLH